MRDIDNTSQSDRPVAALSQPVGIGLRHPYYRNVLDHPPDVGWMEIHPENYFGGGLNRHFLDEIRQHYPMSFHSVGLSFGSYEPVNDDHLANIKELIDLFDPFMVSDHASWSARGNAHLNDLLPLPYTQETLDTLSRNVEKTQDVLQRRILVENPSTYVAYADNDMSEYDLMNALAERTGCGILLDVNNIFVQSFNHGFDPFHYLDEIKTDHVGEIHLAGHTEKDLGNGKTILVDTHSKPVKKDVWDLYAHAVQRFGIIPTLIEWDEDLPELSTILAEADKAKTVIAQHETLSS